MRLNILFAAASAALVAASAAPVAARSPVEPAAKPPARACFWADTVNNFATNDERTVNVRVGVKDVYQFELLGRCPDVDWTMHIAIVSHGTNSICDGMDAEIIAPSAIGPQRCAVKTVRKLTEAEIAALPRRARP